MATPQSAIYYRFTNQTPVRAVFLVRAYTIASSHLPMPKLGDSLYAPAPCLFDGHRHIRNPLPRAKSASGWQFIYRRRFPL